jgi:uncharacterized alpha-E superfamily protein
MLGKTAGGLFWMYRYLERAENTARLIEAGQRIALTRLDAGDSEWSSILQASGGKSAFDTEHEAVSRDAVVDWMLRSRANPSSVLSCIEAARQNARVVRTALTGEVWGATNAAYMRMREKLARKVSERDLPEVLREIRQHTSLVRGMTYGTLLRNDIYYFVRLGTYLERADNTARILDVKYYVLLPSISAVRSSLDNVQWETILRSVSARGGFRMEYGAGGGPEEITEFLTLNTRMPRSLAFCAHKLRSSLRVLHKGNQGSLASLELVGHLQDNYLSQDVSAVFERGLHEFIQEVLDQLRTIAQQIEIDFRFYE